MKLVIHVILWGLLGHLPSFDTFTSTDHDPGVELKFKEYITEYNKTYEVGTKLYTERLAIFRNNVKISGFLNENRTHNFSAWYGITKFSDLSPQEFKEQFLSGYVHVVLNETRLKETSAGLNLQVSSLPKRVDWRTKNVVSPIKNQHGCGGCWAFSTVSVAETMYALKTGDLRQLSVQETLDCSFGYHRTLASCRGGDTCTALNWMKEMTIPLLDVADYPTVDRFQACEMLHNGTSGVKIKDFACQNLVKNENQMMHLLANHGPLAVTVDATTWHNYQGGVIQYHCPSHRNHAVVLVGYDLTGPIPYYIVRNSWGSDWGHTGYLYLRAGVDICGVAEEVSSLDVSEKRAS